jgi:hypothetical protein
MRHVRRSLLGSGAVLLLVPLLTTGTPFVAPTWAQECSCPAPTAVPRCTAATPPPRTFQEVFASAGALEGRAVTVRATLHRFFECADRMTTEGSESTCSGRAALIERRARDERVIGLGSGDTTGPYSCSGTAECPCCRVDVRDQTVVVTGILDATPTVRIESPVICSAR